MKTVRLMFRAISDVLLLSAYIHFFGILVPYAIINSDFRPLNFFNILQFQLLFPKIATIKGYDIIATLCLSALLIICFASRAKKSAE